MTSRKVYKGEKRSVTIGLNNKKTGRRTGVAHPLPDWTQFLFSGVQLPGSPGAIPLLSAYFVASLQL